MTDYDVVGGFEDYLEKHYSPDLEGIESIEERSTPLSELNDAPGNAAVILEEGIDIREAQEAMDEAGYKTKLDESDNRLSIYKDGFRYAYLEEGQTELEINVFEDQYGEVVPSGGSEERMIDSLITCLDHRYFEE